MGAMEGPLRVEPFTIAVDEAVLSDLRDRIARTRWPDAMDGAGWEGGVDPEYLRSLLAYWASEFDWRAQERRLNRFKHYLAHVDGARVHFAHEPGNGPDPLPIVLTHGFPSSFVEHLELLPLLTDPAAHGGRADDAFDVVVTSLPGYGFSDPLPEPMLESTVADMWCKLMRDALGYTRFGAHGSDVGSGVTIELGLRHPDHLIGIHLSAFYLYPPPEPWPQAVRQFIERSTRERAEDVAYSRMQATKPPTGSPIPRRDSPPGSSISSAPSATAAARSRPVSHATSSSPTSPSTGPLRALGLRCAATTTSTTLQRRRHPVAASGFPPASPSSPTATSRAVHALRGN
jgi:pimeloyl-ACP methyl ester carboxylesterase